MLDKDMVGKFFLDLTGEEDISAWSDLLAICISEMEGMLKSGISIEKGNRQLCYAAAALALYRYSLKNSASGVSSFKAGDVSIGMGGSVESSFKLYKEAVGAVKEYISSDNFAFVSI